MTNASSNTSSLPTIQQLYEILEHEHQVQKDNTNAFFVVTMSMIIFLMQCGFAFLEAGTLRSKNVTNILLKNLLDFAVGGLTYWAFGYAFAFGEGSGFIGGSGFFGTFPEKELLRWLFHMVFSATAVTIVSGSMAERCEFVAYLSYSIILTALCYPVLARWAWHDNSEVIPNDVGWLADGVSIIQGAKYKDFAGSGVVHVCGGTAGLFGALFLGPRIGRFNEDGQVNSISGHSVPLTALGGFMLMFGFFAFNGGSQFSISEAGDGIIVAKSVINTMISGSASGIATMALQRIMIARNQTYIHQRTWSLLATINGMITGMVAISAGADVMATWGAFATGVVSALAYFFGAMLLVRVKIDDPLNAVAVHGFGGTWGLIAAPIFDNKNGIITTGSTASFNVLAMNLIGWLVIVAWTSAICAPLFGLLKLAKVLRVDPNIEERGLDVPKHAEPAYPSEAWGDGWGDFLKAVSEALEYHRSGALISTQNRSKDTDSDIDGIVIEPSTSKSSSKGVVVSEIEQSSADLDDNC